jgi:hypothetical protein
VAKPALGKGLGELLNDTTGPRSLTETHTAAGPHLGAEKSTLVGRPSEPLPTAPHPRSTRVLRASLLFADVALTGGAALHCWRPTPLDTPTIVTALLAVSLGAWLGWLGLTWEQE